MIVALGGLTALVLTGCYETITEVTFTRDADEKLVVEVDHQHIINLNAGTPLDSNASANSYLTSLYEDHPQLTIEESLVFADARGLHGQRYKASFTQEEIQAAGEDGIRVVVEDSQYSTAASVLEIKEIGQPGARQLNILFYSNFDDGEVYTGAAQEFKISQTMEPGDPGYVEENLYPGYNEIDGVPTWRFVAGGGEYGGFFKYSDLEEEEPAAPEEDPEEETPVEPEPVEEIEAVDEEDPAGETEVSEEADEGAEETNESEEAAAATESDNSDADSPFVTFAVWMVLILILAILSGLTVYIIRTRRNQSETALDASKE